MNTLLHAYRRLTSTGVRKFTVATIVALVGIAVGYGIWQHAHIQQQNSYDQKAVLFNRPEAAGPLLTAYQQRTQAALNSDQPILQLTGLSGEKALAQDAAIAVPDMQAAAHDKDSGQALRAQVFQVNPLPDAQTQSDSASASCKGGMRCYVVEIYFFASNSTGKVVVGIKADSSIAIVGSNIIPYSQPELPQELTDITKELIANSQELKDTVHETVDISKLTMVNGKTALKATRCDRSEHLCVAPTLAEHDEAYWIIVDMTDARIVGVTWTYWKDKVPDVPPSEQTVIDAAITQKYCGVDNSYDADGWKFSYSLTGSDGLEVKQVSYKGTAMIASAKNTDWHVSYSHQQGFGYSDAVGCPVFSTAAVVPATEPQLVDIKGSDGSKIGFELVQEFKSKLWPQPCNYYYQQRFQFYNDGSFRPAVVSLGRGCGDDGTYRPVTRIQPATTYTNIQQWDGNQWQGIAKEEWEKDTPGAPLPENQDQQNSRYRLSSPAGTLGLTLGRGQFNDGGHGDNAWVYIDRFHPDKDEGASDLATLGSCCNLDYKQGPDIFTNNEPLTNSPLLLWYVSEQKNNATPGEEYCWANASISNGVYKTNTFPCVSGPKIQFIQ